MIRPTLPDAVTPPSAQLSHPQCDETPESPASSSGVPHPQTIPALSDYSRYPQPRAFLTPHAHPSTASIPTSTGCAPMVRRPTETTSTPVSATLRTESSPIPPEASSSTCGSLLRARATARRVWSTLMLSNIKHPPRHPKPLQAARLSPPPPLSSFPGERLPAPASRPRQFRRPSPHDCL